MKAIKKIFKAVFSYLIDVNKGNWVYKSVALLGLIIRVGFLPLLIPSVFDIIADLMVSSWGLPQWAYEIIIRIILLIIDSTILSNIFYWSSFASVGNSYEKGSEPAWGSFCYTLYYLAYNIAAALIIQYFEYWVIVVAFLLFIVLCAGIYLISYALKTLPDSWKVRISIHAAAMSLIFIILMVIRGVI